MIIQILQAMTDVHPGLSVRDNSLMAALSPRLESLESPTSGGWGRGGVPEHICGHPQGANKLPRTMLVE